MGLRVIFFGRERRPSVKGLPETNLLAGLDHCGAKSAKKVETEP